jgi:hypothetical protein
MLDQVIPIVAFGKEVKMPTVEVRSQVSLDELTKKRREETLTPGEHQELLALVDHIEQADVERVQTLIELALQRNVTVTTLMAELGINRPAYA